MHRDEVDTSDPKQDARRRPYVRPVVQCFGEVRSLTRGGSGPGNEAMHMAGTPSFNMNNMV